MRVISGKFRGIVLTPPPDRAVRPTTDRVKESMFDLISYRLDGAKVLDLFSGSGALGIEALSRGAEYCLFADSSRESLRVTESNLKKICASFDIERGDFKKVLGGLSASGAKFDVVFLDPPYKTGLAAEALAAISEYSVLEKGGVIVVERARDDRPTVTPDGYRIVDSRAYGSSVVELVEKCTAAAVTGTFDPFTLGHLYLVEKAAEAFDKVYVVMLVNPDKTPSIPEKKRLKLIKLSLRKLPYKVETAFYDGLAIDYLAENNIKYIVRGVRSAADFEYESKMAEWNYAHGGVRTLLVPARDSDISSGRVRELISEHKSLKGLIDEDVRGILEGDRPWTK